jgi:hypothetical protein
LLPNFFGKIFSIMVLSVTRLIDSHSVKTTESGGIRGYDAGKKTKGRKRHIIVDMLGLMVHSAEIQDRDGAPGLLKSIRHKWLWLLHGFADGGYAGDKSKLRLKKLAPDGGDHHALRRRRKASSFCRVGCGVERTFA